MPLQPLMLISWNQPSASCLLDLVNQINSQNFAAGALQFSAPAVGTTDTETVVQITPGGSSGLIGSLPFTYERLDIGEYFEGANPTLSIQGTVTTDAILNALLDQFGIYGTTGANDGFTIVTQNDLSGNVIGATLTPNPNHYVWVGVLQVVISPLPLLSSLITNTNVAGFSLPSAQSASCPLAQAVYGLVDGSDMVNELQMLQSGYNFNQYLETWNVGTELLNEPWCANSTPANYNVYGSTVLYNGPATGVFTVPTSTGNWPGWVLVLNLGPACTNRCGQLYITYMPILNSSGQPPVPPLPAVPNLLYN
jgi:hypothetical protein